MLATHSEELAFTLQLLYLLEKFNSCEKWDHFIGFTLAKFCMIATCLLPNYRIHCYIFCILIEYTTAFCQPCNELGAIRETWNCGPEELGLEWK